MKMCFVSVCVLVAAAFTVASSMEFGASGTAGQKCGVEASSNLIHHNPWLVLLEFYRSNRKTEIRCGGTLVNSRYVITAAHCVKKPKYTKIRVRLGDYDLLTDKDCVNGVCGDPVVELDVVEIIAHPGYDGKEYDIAILKLKEDAPYTDFIRPICLPDGKLDNDVTLSAAGWGEIPKSGYFSHVKKILPLPSWTREDCQNVYQNIKLPQNVICAGGEEGIDTCRGDSGGPLTWFRNQAELRGVVSSGNVQCGAKGYPGIYTSVVHYLDWIKATIY